MKPHKSRILAMQAIYHDEYNSVSPEELCELKWLDYLLEGDDTNFVIKLIHGYFDNKQMINSIINQYSDNWKSDRISDVTKAILRISIFQLKYMLNTISAEIIIDEAINLAKEFAEDDAKNFINGILDAYYKAELYEKI